MYGLQDLVISRVRVGLLELFFGNPSGLYYVREISRTIKEEINAVRRELDRLVEVGVLKKEERGNRLYYFVNTQYPFFQEMRSIVVKSTGLGLQIRKLKRKLGKVEFAMFSGEFVEGRPPRQDRVDILIVGEVVLQEATALVKEEEQRRGQEINFTVFSSEEFEFRKSRRDPFVMDILYGTRIMVIGDEVEFAQRAVAGI